jgi:hypothetical protein
MFGIATDRQDQGKHLARVARVDDTVVEQERAGGKNAGL